MGSGTIFIVAINWFIAGFGFALLLRSASQGRQRRKRMAESEYNLAQALKAEEVAQTNLANALQNEADTRALLARVKGIQQ